MSSILHKVHQCNCIIKIKSARNTGVSRLFCFSDYKRLLRLQAQARRKFSNFHVPHVKNEFSCGYCGITYATH